MRTRLAASNLAKLGAGDLFDSEALAGVAEVDDFERIRDEVNSRRGEFGMVAAGDGEVCEAWKLGEDVVDVIHL